jgi:hypothetical protein
MKIQIDIDVLYRLVRVLHALGQTDSIAYQEGLSILKEKKHSELKRLTE